MPHRQLSDLRKALRALRLEFTEEQRFHPVRRWRFDLALPTLKIGIEYHGHTGYPGYGPGSPGGHATIKGLTRDCEKFNAAVAAGWRVLAFTALHFDPERRAALKLAAPLDRLDEVITAAFQEDMAMKGNIHVMLDIEALGLAAGAAVVQLGAVAFSLEGGPAGETFHRHIRPEPGMGMEDPTLRWHAEKGTWPPPEGTRAVPLERAVAEFARWLAGLGAPVSFWSWGSTYDFPLLEAAYAALGRKAPWDYWQACCARTVWRMAFPGRRPAPRPHHALEDALAAVRDLLEAREKRVC